jgi:hypothetical protein
MAINETLFTKLFTTCFDQSETCDRGTARQLLSFINQESSDRDHVSFSEIGQGLTAFQLTGQQRSLYDQFVRAYYKENGQLAYTNR